jgi:DNA-binding beta-propeller fold protein YncE
MEFKTNFLIKYTVIAPIFSIVLAIGMLNFNQALATNQTNTLPSHAILQLINKWGYVGTGHGNFSLYNPLDPDPIHHACSIIEQSTATPGTLPTCYPNPRGITIDYFGNVYVVDTIGRQIQKFDSNGHFIKSWGSYGNGNNQFSLPWDISSDSSGHLYIADNCCNHRIEVYNSDGTFIKKWGGFGPVNGNGTFDSPSSIAVDPIRHFVYVSDAYNRVQKFDSNGNFITKWGQNNLSQTGNIGSQGLAVDPNGNVYVTNWFQDSVSKFDNNGHLITMGNPWYR